MVHNYTLYPIELCFNEKLTPRKFRGVVGTNSSIYNDSPTFCGHDIHIYDQCHSNTDSYCNASYYSEVNTPQKSSLFVNTNNVNSENHLTVEDYEVWGRA
ncbi:hypothetical protein WA158_005157 [Blastocystis sp. Blastoise]